MSCFRILYQNYLAVLNGKNWVVDLVLKDAFVLIKVVAGRKEIDPYKQLSVLIDLLDKYDLENYGFNSFVRTEIISIRDCYDSTYLFKSTRL